jgi:hypothetical protein
MVAHLTFWIGWLLFVLGQAQNSIRSTSNSLEGWRGFLIWLRIQAVNLVTRAFFCVLLYPVLVGSMAGKLLSFGLALTFYGVAGFAGYGANAALYQFLGFFPYFRKEIPSLAPVFGKVTYSAPTTDPVSGVSTKIVSPQGVKE